jgi:hypothetical protein
MGDLERYLEDIVEPTIKDFEQHPTSKRHAFLACVVVYHGVDYLAFPGKSRTLRQKFGNKSPEFAMVDRVAHAFKHVVTNPTRPDSLKATDLIPRPPAFWGTMVLGLSRFGDATGGVTLHNDRDVDLLDVVKRATAFLRAQINGHQI